MKRAWVLVLAIAALAFAIWYFMRDKEQAAAYRTRQTATRTLAEYLAKKFPDARVLVISNPFTPGSGTPSEVLKMEQAGIAGLRQGFGSKANLNVTFPELKPAARSNPRSYLTDPETPTPLSYLVAEDAFDKLAADSDVVVSLIGLPVALDKVQCWQKSGKPSFGLLLPDLRIIGGAAEVRKAVSSGKLAAFVMARPGGTKDQFVLVTPENFDQMQKQYPKLLPD
jgi:hypothetical protein